MPSCKVTRQVVSVVEMRSRATLLTTVVCAVAPLCDRVTMLPVVSPCAFCTRKLVANAARSSRRSGLLVKLPCSAALKKTRLPDTRDTVAGSLDPPVPSSTWSPPRKLAASVALPTSTLILSGLVLAMVAVGSKSLTGSAGSAGTAWAGAADTVMAGLCTPRCRALISSVGFALTGGWSCAPSSSSST